MKVLFIGLGSAGQRHLRNIKRILGDDVEVLAYRVRKLKRVFDDNLNVIEDKSLQELYQIQEYYDLDEALSNKPDITVIANPNSMHIDCAIKAAKAGSHLFIEKPLAINFEGIDELIQIVKENKLKAYVGFQNRFHPCVKKLKTIIEEKRLGKLISVYCEIGELLTGMHKYEDYRGMNESQQSTGGGVVLCQIHELDYLSWIFGMPKELFSIGGKNSDLEIDVEDHALTLCRYQDEHVEFPIIIQQDFLQSPPVRRCKAVGENGVFEMDLLKNRYTLTISSQPAEEEDFISFKRNDMFLDEMECFLNCIEQDGKEFVDLHDGLKSLSFALAIKESMHHKMTAKFEENENGNYNSRII